MDFIKKKVFLFRKVFCFFFEDSRKSLDFAKNRDLGEQNLKSEILKILKIECFSKSKSKKC